MIGDTPPPQGKRICGLEPEWELFDLEQDPQELHNVYHDPAYADVASTLTAQLHRLQQDVGDEPFRDEPR